MKCVVIFKILISYTLISFNDGQFHFPTPDTGVTDIYRTPAFFSADFPGFPQYDNSKENLVESPPKKDDEDKDSTAEGSEQEYSTSVVKNFYFHAAPEEEPVQRITKEVELESSAQNYKIIFIRAPAPPKKVIRLKAIYRAPNEKTVVYVLHKKPEDVEIESIATLPKNRKPLQPDVFFVKYNTGDEAEDIQKTIQAQYNYLGGTTNLHHVDAGRTLEEIDEKSVLPALDEGDSTLKKSRRSVRYTKAIRSSCFYC